MITKLSAYTLLFFALLTACLSCESKQSEPVTTLILVRHAEKVRDNPDDPPLNKQGEARAKLLAAKLKETRLNAIYSTPFTRTTKTVEPVAEQKNMEINRYDPEKDLVSFIEEILNKHAGQTILITGHSSTIPGMLNVLTKGENYQNLAKNDYNDIFIASTTGKANTGVLHINYGDPVINK